MGCLEGILGGLVVHSPTSQGQRHHQQKSKCHHGSLGDCLGNHLQSYFLNQEYHQWTGCIVEEDHTAMQEMYVHWVFNV